VSAATPLARKVWAATREVARAMDGLEFAAPVTHVYNPLKYARAPHRAYVERFAATPKRVLFLGMNPGPFGMGQTGVPFGEIAAVRDWMGIKEKVLHPEVEHPKRPVQGFSCTRAEVSGARLWGAVAEHWQTPERFFAEHYVINYCPLLFMEESGRNRTPDKLPSGEREPIYAACDKHLRRLVTLLEPHWLIGVGAFATDRARHALGESGPKIETLLHPSPANPRANRGWKEAASAQLRAIGICG
jgi:single-strand selective monofunctional uracil DNA glycosylase